MNTELVGLENEMQKITAKIDDLKAAIVAKPPHDRVLLYGELAGARSELLGLSDRIRIAQASTGNAAPGARQPDRRYRF